MVYHDVPSSFPVYSPPPDMTQDNHLLDNYTTSVISTPDEGKNYACILKEATEPNSEGYTTLWAHCCERFAGRGQEAGVGDTRAGAGEADDRAEVGWGCLS
jgi:hypothetical protein